MRNSNGWKQAGTETKKKSEHMCTCPHMTLLSTLAQLTCGCVRPRPMSFPAAQVQPMREMHQSPPAYLAVPLMHAFIRFQLHYLSSIICSARHCETEFIQSAV